MNLTLTENVSPLILIADDDKVMRLQLRKAMEQQGYQVAEASDGDEAIAAYIRLHPHIVLLDANMPVMDGFTCCNKLQKLPGGDRTPVLMITGLDDQASVDRAFDAGATDYVTKPIHWAVLRQRVRRLLRELKLTQNLETGYQELQQIATLDSLTQVANRRRFDECLYQEWRRMVKEKTPLSVLLCDIDFFKVYNDTYGHQAGDRCLQQIARAISSATRHSTDLVGRYGGEEFAVVLPNTKAEGAFHIAEKIRSNVKNLSINNTNSLVSQHVTLSLGIVSTLPSNEFSPQLLIAAVEKALYQAKQRGRDRIVVLESKG